MELRKQVDPEHDFKEAFRVFDRDGKWVLEEGNVRWGLNGFSGKVDAEELRKVLMECGRMKLTEEETREFIGEEEEDDGNLLSFNDKKEPRNIDKLDWVGPVDNKPSTN